jgi:hypothetical protein
MNIITIGKKLVAAEQIALVEPFDPTANPDFKPERDYKSRVILLNRDTVLAEMSPHEFAEANGFHLLAGDVVAVNPATAFRVETFEPTEDFKPQKGYRTRIKWRDPDGNEQSKLLIMEPETVVFELSNRRSERRSEVKSPPRRPARKRRTPRNLEGAQAK